MRGGRILWGQIAVVFAIVLVTTWTATQWTAWRLGFLKELSRDIPPFSENAAMGDDKRDGE